MGKRFLIELAKKSDESALRRIARDNYMEGNIRLSVQREPDFFSSLEVEGRFIQVCLGRDLRNNKVIGFAVRAIKEMFVNGSIRDIGYLSNLRLDKTYRGGTIIYRAYRFLKELHRDGWTQLYLTSILQDNQYAIKMLTSGRAGLPRYKDFGGYTAYAVGLKKKRGDLPVDLELRRGSEDMIEDVVLFLREEGKRKQFYPVYREADFLSTTGLLRGLRVDDLIIALRRSKVVGVIGLWDQTAVKQDVISGYSSLMRIIKPLWNAYAPLRDLPSLPVRDTPLNFFFASMNLVKNNKSEIFHALIEQLRSEGRERGFDHMVLGLHSRDTLNSVIMRYPSYRLRSRIFLVHWEDGEQLYGSLDDRIPYLEVAAL